MLNHRPDTLNPIFCGGAPPQIRAACLELDPAYSPPITFLVVQKRHHTRFFPTDPRAADRSGNVPPGGYNL